MPSLLPLMRALLLLLLPRPHELLLLLPMLLPAKAALLANLEADAKNRD